MLDKRTAVRPIIAITLTIACSSLAARDKFVQYLDETTAVTVTAMKKPFVFYKEESGLAANLRDYVDVGPLEINRSGERTYYLWAGIWSTLDRGPQPTDPSREDVAKMIIIANDRPIELALFSESQEMLGTVEQIYPEPADGTRNVFYKVTIEQLRAIYEADFVYVSFGELNPRDGLYRAWKTPKKSLKHFLDYAVNAADS